MRGKRTLVYGLLALATSAVLLVLLVKCTTLQPASVQEQKVVCPGDAPLLAPGDPVKVLSWNVQYMASKRYVFWYDLLDGSGPDTRPSPDAIDETFAEVARVIAAEQPDVILLQELNDGAIRTNYEDQLARLLTLLPDNYRCTCEAFYWQAAFVPHPRIMGPSGMKLATLSRYKIASAKRHQLPLPPNNFFVRHFSHKRAILETRLRRADGSEIALLNTHFDAWAKGSDTMARQVQATLALVTDLTAAKTPWLIGGDFNLLAPGATLARLHPRHQANYNTDTELAEMFQVAQAVPGLYEINGPNHRAWNTYFPNHPEALGPDRSIDFIFVDKTATLGKHYVRHHDTSAISDHLPVVTEVVFSAAQPR